MKELPSDPPAAAAPEWPRALHSQNPTAALGAARPAAQKTSSQAQQRLTQGQHTQPLRFKQTLGARPMEGGSTRRTLLLGATGIGWGTSWGNFAQ